ncbi:Protein detoxification 49 [Vitis vinifera]|uniref:Protein DETOXIFICATION n=1 Tax=Vitis vinifera TaxID=29760 RepID=A0A438JJ83_VITVI|nr:Protein detoxification 49 [Vitis vinifera]
MCQLPSSAVAYKFRSDQTGLLSAVEQEPHMLTPLVPKAPTLDDQPHGQEQNPSKTHLSLALTEARHIASIAFPMILTGLLLYSRSMISMLFLGRLGELALAGGSLAIGFANITGYSILSGLAMGMEPICGQAFGAQRYKLLGLTLQRTVLLLLLTSIPIAFLWFNMKEILLFFVSPPSAYLSSNPVHNTALTYCATLAILLHIPINYFLVSVLDLGIKGVALSGIWTNLNLVGSLIAYVVVSRVYKKTWGGVSSECLRDWKSLLNLAVPSCISVCLEWWWYEIMILLCGLLLNPRATVASMGILIQTTALIYIFPSSLSFSLSTRVGNELGANRPEKARLAAIVGLSSSFILGFLALFFAVMVRKTWATMFTQDPEILTLTSMVLPIIGLCELGNCPQTTGCGALRGTARPKLGANINLGCFYLVGMPVAVWLGFFAGFDFKGLWLGLLAAQGSCAVTMLFVLFQTNWDQQAQRAKELTGTGSDDDEECVTLKDETTQDSTNSLV